MEERFTYDWLNRLTGIIENGDTTGVFVYDDYGRMTMKRLHGEMVFDSTAYGTDGRPHALERATVYAEQPEQWIRYTSFDMLQSIEQTDPVLLVDCHLRYDFGYDNVTRTFDRGYTLHEHYDEFDLINMNGRLYDPILGRMLSPDVVIQDEQSSQAYNRYSYCFNNPLRFTDPSGYVVRGMHNYYDWNSMVYYDFGNYRSSGSAFNTDLSEGKFSPIYDVNGYFLGTDDEGLQGEAIVMRREDFRQGMRHEDALAMATELDAYNADAEIRLYSHYSQLRNRPDWDGFVSISEGIQWAKSHIGALEDPTPDNMLYINTALLDFGNITIGDFSNGEGKVSPINLFNYNSSLHFWLLSGGFYAIKQQFFENFLI